MKNYLRIILLLSMSFITHAEVNFDSSVSREFKIKIESAEILTDHPEQVLQEIKNQTKYLFGIFLGFEGGVSWNGMKIQVKQIDPFQNSQKAIYSIEAYVSLPVSWDQMGVTVPLPTAGDEKSLQQYVELYEKDCSIQITGVAGFWYYSRPFQDNCPLKSTAISESVTLVNIEFTPSDRATHDKKPEYRRIWEDNVLEMTFMITKNHENDQTGYGISDYNELYQGLIDLLGKPSKSSVVFAGSPGILFPELHLDFKYKGKIVKTHLFLIDNLNNNTDKWLNKLNPFIAESDFASYNGHSGLGINIDHLASGIRFKKDKYQILFLNSCATYGHLGDELLSKREEINPNNKGSKFLDIVLNSTKNYFGTFSPANIFFTKSFLDKTQSYSEILSELDSYQHSVVIGEEDNEE